LAALPTGVRGGQCSEDDLGGQPWVLAFEARTADPGSRAELAARFTSARVARFGWLVLQTCRRVELLGAGPRPSADTLVSLTGVRAAASAREHVGPDARRHVLRLAAGLESAVVGEDQVLGQVSRLRRSADGTPAVDGRLVGLLDLAIRVGRQARAERPRGERSLADRGLAWLEARLGKLAGARLLVVGNGPIGREACRLAGRAGAMTILASRSRGGRRQLTLAQAAGRLEHVDGVVVALADTWSDLLDADLARLDARQPFMVDLSDPPAIPGPVRVHFGDHLGQLEALTRQGTPTDARTVAYVLHAEALVEEALDRLARAADASIGDSIRALREDADARRRQGLETLFRRLSEVDPAERELIERFSRSLVAGILHGPTQALRDGR